MRTQVRPRIEVPSPNAGIRAPFASIIGADMPALTVCPPRAAMPRGRCWNRSWRGFLVDLAADQHAADLLVPAPIS